jgi:hypothetical protein
MVFLTLAQNEENLKKNIKKHKKIIQKIIAFINSTNVSIDF